jgi:prepilin-type N-terminal cleavage/methylation domain-containing protein
MRTTSKTIGRQKSVRGFSLLEMLIAMALLLVGIVSVVQLVPASLQSNQNNRQDTTATVVAQRELDQILNQPIQNTSFTDDDGRTINLGDPSKNNVLVGAPVIAGTANIDFTQAVVAGYNFTYVDPNNLAGANYEVRWAIVTTTNAGAPVSKRIIMACWHRNSHQITVPVNIDTTVQK